MPVAAKVRGVLRDNYQVADTGLDTALAAGAEVLLARLIGLDRLDDQGSQW